MEQRRYLEFTFDEMDRSASIGTMGEFKDGVPKNTALERLLRGYPEYIIRDFGGAKINISRGNGRTDSQECHVVLLYDPKTNKYALCVKRELSRETSYEIFPLKIPDNLLTADGALPRDSMSH